MDSNFFLLKFKYIYKNKNLILSKFMIKYNILINNNYKLLYNNI